MKAPSGEQWVHEVKHDGYRLMARKVDGREVG
jgi:ATP-dependent DNA ligase